MARTARRILITTLAAALSVATLAACGGSDEVRVGDSTVETDGDTTTITDGQGNTAEVGTGATLPDGWPDSFPLPDGISAVGSFSEADVGFTVSWTADAGTDVVGLFDFFDAQLPANGWTIDQKLDSSDDSGTYRTYVISGNGYSGMVYVSSYTEMSTDQPALIVSLTKDQG